LEKQRPKIGEGVMEQANVWNEDYMILAFAKENVAVAILFFALMLQPYTIHNIPINAMCNFDTDGIHAMRELMKRDDVFL